VLISMIVVSVLGADISGVPLFGSQNPIETNRSVLFAPPLLMPSEDWAATMAFDYSSAIELYETKTRSMLLDAELGRFQVSIVRRIDDRWFGFGQFAVQGAYDGFMDRFINWYHKLVGVDYYARDIRPLNKYGYYVQYDKDHRMTYSPVDLGPADSKLGIGRRFGENLQLLFVLGLPTAIAPGFRAGTVQAGLMFTGQLTLTRWMVTVGTLGIGATPRTGTLAPYENVVFASASVGLRIRLSWMNSIYGNLWFHTAPMHGMDMPPTDNVDLSVDFGWILRIDQKTELWISMVEDPYPDGPALDVAFRFGLRLGF
jgi:hypothetical protein